MGTHSDNPAQLAGAVEYDFISANEKTPLNECPRYDTK